MIASLRRITIRYPGQRALDHVSLDIRPGDTLFLAGDNGSGKTTLLKLLAGTLPDTAVVEGSLFYGDHDVSGLNSSSVAHAAGVRYVPQAPLIIGALSVQDNFMLGLGRFRWTKRRQAGHSLLAEATQLADSLGWSIPWNAASVELSAREAQEIALLRALLARSDSPPLLLLDEGTAYLEADAASFLAYLPVWQQRTNAAILCVSHLERDLVMGPFAKALMLRAGVIGRTIELPQAFDDRQAVVAEVFGSELLTPRLTSATHQGPPILVLDCDYTDNGTLERTTTTVKLKVGAGEIISLLVTPRSLFDAMVALFAGEPTPSLTLNRLFIRSSTYDSLANVAWHTHGVGFISEGRTSTSGVGTLPVRDNILISDDYAPFWLASSEADTRVHRVLATLAVPENFAERSLNQLSGGYQQRVLLAREMEVGGTMLVLESPFQGLDRRTAEQLRNLMQAAAINGRSFVLLFSDERSCASANIADERAITSHHGVVASVSVAI